MTFEWLRGLFIACRDSHTCCLWSSSPLFWHFWRQNDASVVGTGKSQQGGPGNQNILRVIGVSKFSLLILFFFSLILILIHQGQDGVTADIKRFVWVLGWEEEQNKEIDNDLKAGTKSGKWKEQKPKQMIKRVESETDDREKRRKKMNGVWGIGRKAAGWACLYAGTFISVSVLVNIVCGLDHWMLL